MEIGTVLGKVRWVFQHNFCWKWNHSRTVQPFPGLCKKTVVLTCVIHIIDKKIEAEQEVSYFYILLCEIIRKMGDLDGDSDFL